MLFPRFPGIQGGLSDRKLGRCGRNGANFGRFERSALVIVIWARVWSRERHLSDVWAFVFGLSRGSLSRSLLLPCIRICNTCKVCVNGAMISPRPSDNNLPQPAS